MNAQTHTIAFLGTTAHVYPLGNGWTFRIAGRWPAAPVSSKDAAILAAKVQIAGKGAR